MGVGERRSEISYDFGDTRRFVVAGSNDGNLEIRERVLSGEIRHSLVVCALARILDLRNP